MRMAYADPPYLGMGKRYDHPESHIWDTVEAHHDLVRRLCAEFPDGWALSLSVPSLRHILPACPEDVRVGSWVKTFAAFKPNVNPAYAWEPLLWRGGRARGREAATTRDWIACPITLRRGVCGAKPERFSWWVFDLLGMGPDDELVDLFPGSGAVTRAWEHWRRAHRTAGPLFMESEI